MPGQDRTRQDKTGVGCGQSRTEYEKHQRIKAGEAKEETPGKDKVGDDKTGEQKNRGEKEDKAGEDKTRQVTTGKGKQEEDETEKKKRN